MDIHALGKYRKMILELKLSLVGEEGLDNIEELLKKVKENNTPGIFLEAGIWRGGACIWARAMMDYLKINEPVYACDSFEGVPNPQWKEDWGDQNYLMKELAVSLNTVKENFNYFVLEGPVRFIKGLFKDTMPMIKEEIEAISFLRIDGDLYESTTQVLDNLYDKVSKNGFIIIDDYALAGAKMAVDDFRVKRNIETPLVKVNDTIHYWQK